MYADVQKSARDSGDIIVHLPLNWLFLVEKLLSLEANGENSFSIGLFQIGLCIVIAQPGLTHFAQTKWVVRRFPKFTIETDQISCLYSFLPFRDSISLPISQNENLQNYWQSTRRILQTVQEKWNEISRQHGNNFSCLFLPIHLQWNMFLLFH